MKKTLYLTLFVVSVFAFQTFGCGSVYAGEDPSEKPFIKEIDKIHLLKKGGLFGLDLSIKLGFTSSKTNFDVNPNDTSAAVKELNSTSSIPGPSIGADITISFLGIGITTGMVYSKKGFQTTDGTNYNFHYFIIPLLFNLNFDIGQVAIEGSFGPYFGLLLSNDEFTQNNLPVYNMNNFDLGLTANIQGTYMFTKVLGILLGYKYEYGGLNNLASNESINKMTTQTHFFFTGLKVAF
jgi:hypothetical protein